MSEKERGSTMSEKEREREREREREEEEEEEREEGGMIRVLSAPDMHGMPQAFDRIRNIMRYGRGAKYQLSNEG